MNRRNFIRTGSLATMNAFFLKPLLSKAESLALGQAPFWSQHLDLFANPPLESLPGCYWWWLNGLVNKKGITRDLEEFRDKGINDLLLVNSAGRNMPVGVKFLSEEWKELFRHALREAKRLEIQIGVNLSSGWCMGGPWISPEMAGRWFLQSEVQVEGPSRYAAKLPLPGNRSGYDKVFNPPGYKAYIDLPLEELDYRDTAVVAFPLPDEESSRFDQERRLLLPAKSNRRDASNHAPAWDIMGPTLEKWTNSSSDQAIEVEKVIDLSSRLTPDGYLEWDVPSGRWVIVRTGHRMTGSRLSIAQPEADGLSVGWLNSQGVEKQFEALGSVLLQEAKSVGFSLKFFCDDSFEDGFPNWTAAILDEFKRYRAYDALPYLPVLSGYIVGSASVSERFLYDYRKTVADCMADRHYKRFADLCHEHGLLVQNESAGPSRSGTMCMDGLKNLGRSDFPTGEFWLGVRHDEEGGLDLPYGQSRLENGQNKVTKMVACAAHIYGKKLASAESYTTYRHWMDCPASLKQSTDRAFCEGINRILIHTSSATRPEDGLPGYEYYAGTHFNPNVTWWNQSKGFLSYIGRCQYLLRKGLFVADLLFYNGDWAPNIVLPKQVDPSLGSGYDYDVCNEEVLLQRLSVRDGRLTLPDGMSYRILVLPETDRMPLPVAQKIEELVKNGATVFGPPPAEDPGLHAYPQCDEAVREIASRVWGRCDGKEVVKNNYGKGRVYYGLSVREFLISEGILPDFEAEGGASSIDYIHRSSEEAEIYFVSNLSNRPQEFSCLFRQTGRRPEVWDPVSGRKYRLNIAQARGSRTLVPMRFEAFQSFFIVFPSASADCPAVPYINRNYPHIVSSEEVSGEWELSFDPQWGGPAAVVFDRLMDWTDHPDESIRYYSGKAIYRKRFSLHSRLPKAGTVFLDLGKVKNIAEVRLNKVDLGVVWTAPWRVDVTDLIKKKDNYLEIDIINLWPNRLIGDAGLPEEKRLTKTNISFKKDDALLSSGLLGPVSVVFAE